MATMMNYAIVEATAEATARNDARDERAAMGACPGGIDYDEMDEMQFLEKAKELEQRAAQLTFVDVEKQMEALLSSEERAAGVSGDSVKYSAACKVVENRWFRFLAVYGDKLGYEEGSSPSLELVRKFVVYTFKTRTYKSSKGKKGLGDSAELSMRYLLAKFVFPKLLYDGWAGCEHAAIEPEWNRRVGGCVLLSASGVDWCVARLKGPELKAKCAPYAAEINETCVAEGTEATEPGTAARLTRDSMRASEGARVSVSGRWTRLKRSEPEMATAVPARSRQGEVGRRDVLQGAGACTQRRGWLGARTPFGRDPRCDKLDGQWWLAVLSAMGVRGRACARRRTRAWTPSPVAS
jgi:hypothetical protein